MVFFMIQLEFFQTDEVVVLRNKIQNLEARYDRLRKAFFARHGELGKNYTNLNDRLDIIERHICKGSE